MNSIIPNGRGYDVVDATGALVGTLRPHWQGFGFDWLPLDGKPMCGWVNEDAFRIAREWKPKSVDEQKEPK
jgi:hypothetical protein